MEKWAQVEWKVTKILYFQPMNEFNDLCHFISQGWRETWGIRVQGALVEIQVGYPADLCQTEEFIWEIFET